MKRIIVSTTNDLITDQRVHRVCTSLVELNFDVLLIGRKLSNSENLDRNYRTSRMKLLFNNSFMFYAEYNIRLFLKLFFIKKEILLSNDLDTLLPNYLISKLFRKKLIYDSHELFSEVPELINRPFVKRFWLKLEQFLLPKLKNSYTVCDSITNYYNSKYNANFKVIKNFPKTIAKIQLGQFPFEISNKKIILYQGALNVGRGLDLMIDTTQYLENVILILIGTGDIEFLLKQRVKNLNLQEKVKFLGKLTPNQLRTLTPLADLGLSLEEDLGLNYRYALPNKIFDYIQALVPILISDLEEMKKVIELYAVGEIISSREPKKLAEQITNILQNEKGFYSKQLELAKKDLNWDKESEKLVDLFNNLN